MSFNVDWVNTSSNSEWATPAKLFEELDREFHFTLDPCATDENHKCEKYYTKEQDGLLQDWSGETVFMNPPYKGITPWIRKAFNTHTHNRCAGPGKDRHKVVSRLHLW